MELRLALPGADIFERAGLKAWPGIEVEFDGSWVRRAANGYTQRANSVQSLDPSDDANARERLAASRAWFETRGLQPIFRVTPLAGPRIVAALDEAGWDQIDDSHLFAMELRPVAADPRGGIYGLLDPIFLDAQKRLRNYDDEKLCRLAGLLRVVDVPACGIVVRKPDGEPVASALMCVADGIVITGNVVTDERERRKGYGAAMMRTGFAWAKDHGANIAALNVAAENAVGQALYRSLGFRHQYDYTYRVPGRA